MSMRPEEFSFKLILFTYISVEYPYHSLQQMNICYIKICIEITKRIKISQEFNLVTRGFAKIKRTKNSSLTLI